MAYPGTSHQICLRNALLAGSENAFLVGRDSYVMEPELANYHIVNAMNAQLPAVRIMELESPWIS
jgi:hypothetical protein